MKTTTKLLSTSIALLLSSTLIGQSGLNGKSTIKNNNTTKNTKNISGLLKAGQYSNNTVGSGKKAISFTVEKDYPGNKLKTKELKKKKEETSEFCAKDLFKTSGKVNQWNIFDENGYSNVSNIVPGAIFDLSKFSGSFFNAVEGKDRNPIKITIVNDQAARTTKATVQNPKLAAKIREKGVKPIRNTIKKNVAANKYMSVDFERQYSESQLDISLGGTVPYVGGKVKFSASTSNTNIAENHTYLIEYREDYYTLEVDGNSIANKNYFVDKSLNNHSKWGYIESVTYGRKIVAVINSSYSLDEMIVKADLEADILAGNANAGVASTSKNESVNFSYSIYIVGGSSGANNMSIITDHGNIQKLINDINGMINNGKNDATFATPVSFVLKDLAGDLIVSTYSPVEQAVESCNPLYSLKLKNLKVTEVSDGVNKKNIELYGTFQVKAYKDNGTLFRSEKYPSLKNQYGASTANLIDGATEFADKDNVIKRGVADQPYEFNSSKSGDNEWRIPNDALNGYFIIDVNAVDKDSGSKDDEIDGKSLKIYFKDLTGSDEKTIKCVGDKNEVNFTFDITREE